MQNFQLNTSNNKLYAIDWPVDQPKAVVVLIHGLGEHIRRYDHLAAFFNRHGIAVLGFDHPGHGRTEGVRGHAKNMEDLMTGVKSMLQETKKRYPDKAIFLYGHSMGGNITLNYILRKKPDVTGAIITAPHIRMVTEPSAFLVGAGRIANKVYSKGQQPNGLDLQMLSRDQDVIQQYKDDSLVHDKISFGLAIALIDGAKYLNQYEGSSRIPLLLMHGGADGITDPAGTRGFVKRVTNTNYKEWAGFYHEIHNEKEQEKVFNFALDWMGERLRL